MKKNLFISIVGSFALGVIILASCSTKNDDTIYYPGSTLPQNTQYRNPVWEPDLELGTIFKGAATFVAIGSETQWAAGINYLCPTLTSSNLMDWSFNSNMAYPSKPDTIVSGSDIRIAKRPDWAQGRIHSMAAGFAKTVPSTSYWMFYQIGDSQAIGASYALAPQGPYYDTGKLIDNTQTSSQTLKDPFFIVFGTSFYLLYSTESGSFLQRLTLSRAAQPRLNGAPIQISDANMTDVAMFRKDDIYYLLGTVVKNGQSEICYGKSDVVGGPYLDKEGNSLLSGGGSSLVTSGDQLINPCNVSLVNTDFSGQDFILYNVTDKTKTTLASGFNRRPLMLNHFKIDSTGWIATKIQPTIGWCSPKYIDK